MQPFNVVDQASHPQDTAFSYDIKNVPGVRDQSATWEAEDDFSTKYSWYTELMNLDLPSSITSPIVDIDMNTLHEWGLEGAFGQPPYQTIGNTHDVNKVSLELMHDINQNRVQSNTPLIVTTSLGNGESGQHQIPNQDMALVPSDHPHNRSLFAHAALVESLLVSQMHQKIPSQPFNAPLAQATPSHETWLAPQNDPSIPFTTTQHKVYIHALLSSFLSTKNLHDRLTPSMRRRWFPSSTAKPHYPLSHLEALCWRILSSAIEMHTRGSTAITSYSPSLLRNAYKERNWTFKQRMDKVCEVLRGSKARCEKLLGGLHVQGLVGAPGVVGRRVRCNARQNGRRQGILEKGRMVGKEEKGGKKR